MIKSIRRIQKNISYTIQHKKCINSLYRKYVNNTIPLNIMLHDVDKLFMMLFLPKHIVHKIHRKISKHHHNDLFKSEETLLEMVLDWESARYTKPDKPLNA